jgi:hypothetical protein
MFVFVAVMVLLLGADFERISLSLKLSKSNDDLFAERQGPRGTKAAAASSLTRAGAPLPDKAIGSSEGTVGELVSSSSSLSEWAFIRDIQAETDIYAASWLMSIEEFMQVDTSSTSIANREAAVFGALRGRHSKVRLSLDFVDFAVEHLSFWWKLLGSESQQGDAWYNLTLAAMRKYVGRHEQQRHQQTTPLDTPGPLHRTVAVLAYSQIRSRSSDKSRDQTLSAAVLSATVASLQKAGFGRVVVVGSDSADVNVAHLALWMLRLGDHNNTEQQERSSIDLAFALAPPDLVNSTYLTNNVCRGALAGLQRALSALSNSSASDISSSSDWKRQWLGDVDPGYWRYVYYSEFDSPLQTRPSVLGRMRDLLDEGSILVPRRLQLVGYEGDVPDEFRSQVPARLVPIDFQTPLVLNSADVRVSTAASEVPDGNDTGIVYQHCCDALEGKRRPGMTDFERCGSFWYMCGYGKRGNHSRLEPYRFVRLSHGIGITTLAGTEQGRRCIPSFVPCRLRDNKEQHQGYPGRKQRRENRRLKRLVS